MAEDLRFSCRCGGLTGVLHDVAPDTGCHLICYCRDCRAFATHLGVADQLEPGGGSALYQTVPARIEFTKGAEHIACKRLSPKGLHRWYAACCDTPLANTVGSPKMPMAGMWRGLFADHAAMGPVRTHGFVKYARPEAGGPKKDKGILFMFGGLLQRTAAAYLNGTVRQNPFFDAGGRPVAQPEILSKDARIAARTG